jgi:hypothetical protein
MQIQLMDDVKDFVDAVKRGISALKDAGKIAAESQRKDPTFIDRVCDVNPLFTTQMVQRFIDIGEGRIHERLILSESPGVRRLRAMSIAIQNTYASVPVPLLIKNDGNWEILNANVENLTPEQASQVFAATHVRDEAEQRTYIEDRLAKKATPPARNITTYAVERHKLIVHEPCSFTKLQLVKLVRQM